MAANLGAPSKRLQGGFLHFLTGLHGASRGFMALRAASCRFARLHMEPHDPGSGRIGRCDQSPGLLPNPTAADVTMFTDSSVACDGPSVDGPGLAAWAGGVLDGSIRDVPQFEPHILDQLRTLTPASFP